jgi:hypothetical protein
MKQIAGASGLCLAVLVLLLIANRPDHKVPEPPEDSGPQVVSETDTRSQTEPSNEGDDASPDEEDEADLVSPSAGVEELISMFESEVVEDAKQTTELALAIGRWKKDAEKDSQNPEKWPEWKKQPEYWASLNIRDLGAECFEARPHYLALHMGLYSSPSTVWGYHHARIYHFGLGELCERPDMWKGIIHAYEYLSSNLDPQDETGEASSIAMGLSSMTSFYRYSREFREQVKGREGVLLASTLRVLKRFEEYVKKRLEIVKDGPWTQVWAQPFEVARAAMMLAKQIDPSTYYQVELGITSVRFKEGDQNGRDVLSYLTLVITSLDNFVSEEDVTKLEEIIGGERAAAGRS